MSNQDLFQKAIFELLKSQIDLNASVRALNMVRLNPQLPSIVDIDNDIERAIESSWKSILETVEILKAVTSDE